MLTAKVTHGSRTWHVFNENTDRSLCEPNTDYNWARISEGEPSCKKCRRVAGLPELPPVPVVTPRVAEPTGVSVRGL